MARISSRFPVRKMMIAVAIVAVILAEWVGLVEMSYSTRYGPNTSVFSPGDSVMRVECVVTDGVTLPAGSTGTDVRDPNNDDDDSAYAFRIVPVKIDAGENRGSI